MEHYLNWAQALASAWGFMLLVGLVCCCLSTKPRQHGDINNSNGSCSCEGGYDVHDLILGDPSIGIFVGLEVNKVELVIPFFEKMVLGGV
ncbi:hypothetical protein QQP08_016200 [Theobroma cacao]|nr:hypothetical protein QQP08_016200 [Theobroma cacao]